jgi:hypothetical protein
VAAIDAGLDVRAACQIESIAGYILSRRSKTGSITTNYCCGPVLKLTSARICLMPVPQ